MPFGRVGPSGIFQPSPTLREAPQPAQYDEPWNGWLRIRLVRVPRAYTRGVLTKLFPPILGAPVFIAAPVKVILESIGKSLVGRAYTYSLNPPTVIGVTFMPNPLRITLQGVNRASVT